MLYKDSIPSHKFERGFTLLYHFVLMLDPVYGTRYCTLNDYSFLHLPRCAQDLGPLWTYSCFSFEFFNGKLLKYFHGTQAIETQIVGTVNIHQVLPALVKK